MFPTAIVNQAGLPQLDVELFAAAADEWLKSKLIAAWPAFAGGAVRAVPLGDQPDRGEAPMVLTTAVTQPGDLAFHSVTSAGLPTGTAQIPMSARYGIPWQVDACHEIGEMYGNPQLGLRVTGDRGRIYSREIVDFVTSSQMPGLGGVMLCNVVTPEFFEDNPARGAPLDLMGEVTRCLKEGGIPPGGWAQWADPNGSIQSAYGAAVTPAMRAFLAEKTSLPRYSRIREHLGA